MAGGMLDDSVLDAIAEDLIARCERHVVCSGLPANYAAVAGLTLAAKTFAGGDITKGDAGAGTGRTGTVGPVVTAVATASGTPVHVVLVDDTNSLILAISEPMVTPEDVVSGQTYQIGAWPITARDAIPHT